MVVVVVVVGGERRGRQGKRWREARRSVTQSVKETEEREELRLGGKWISLGERGRGRVRKREAGEMKR